ncbi:MAG: tetratricopeptide repeat protein, partial [Acidobacteriota bacterium]
MPLPTILLALAISGGSGLRGAQTPATPTKKVEVEIKDPLKQAAALFDAGQNAHQSGDLQKAIEFYREALARNPSLWPAEFQRSVAHLSLGQLSEARASIDRVIALLSEFTESEELKGISAKAQIVSGEIALAQSNRDLAEKAFRRALELNPQAGQAHGGLAEILLAREKPAEASVEAAQAIAAGDDRSSTWTVLGTAQSMSGRNEEALASLAEGIKRNPRQIAALRLRSEINLARGAIPAALADLRAVLALDDNPGDRLHLAEVLTQVKQFDEAIAIFRNLLVTEPGNTDARTGLAVALIDSG